MNIVSLEHTAVAMWKENTKSNVYLAPSDFSGPRKYFKVFAAWRSKSLIVYERQRKHWRKSGHDSTLLSFVLKKKILNTLNI